MIVKFKREIHVYEDKKRKNQNRLKIQKFKYCCTSFENSEIVRIQTYANSVRSYIREKGQGAYNHDMEKPLLVIITMENEYDDGCSELSVPINNCPWCKEEYEFKLIETRKITHTCRKVKKEYEECIDETSEEIVK